MTAPTPLPQAQPLATAITPARACRILGIRERQLRNLLSIGRLEAIGGGHSKLISVESLALEIERREKSGNIAGNSAITGGGLPNFCIQGLALIENAAQTNSDGMTITISVPGAALQKLTRGMPLTVRLVLAGNEEIQ